MSSLMNLIVNNLELFQTNSTIVNTRNKNLLTPIANLSCFHKGACYTGIRIFNSLPPSLRIISDKKEKFKAALKRYLITHTFYSVDEFLQFKKDS
jgi:hypothetical protein